MIYEMKKLLRRKELWIVLGLSLIAIILLNSRDPWASRQTMKIARQKIAAYGDMPSEEALPLIEREWKRLGGYNISMESTRYEAWRVLRSLIDGIEKNQAREERMKELLPKMYNDLAHAATDFERRDISHAIKLYNHRIPYRVNQYLDLGFAIGALEYIDARQNLYVLILCTMLSPLFAVELETGMYQVLFASKKGKAGLFRKKIGGGILCAALLAFFYTAVLFAMVFRKYGLNMQLLFSPVQCIETYQNCPYVMSVLTYTVLTACMRALIGALVVALTALMSCCFRKTLAVFGTTVTLVFIPLLLSELFTNVPVGQMVMKRLGLMRLSHLSDYLTQYETVNVFGYPVAQIWLSVGCTCGITLCLLAAAYALYTKEHSRKRVKSC